MNMMNVKLLKTCWVGKRGDEKQMHRDGGMQLVKDGFAVEVESDKEAREARKAESLELQDKAFTARDKRLEKEAKAKEAKAKRSRGRKKVDNKALTAPSKE